MVVYGASMVWGGCVGGVWCFDGMGCVGGVWCFDGMGCGGGVWCFDGMGAVVVYDAAVVCGAMHGGLRYRV